MPKGTVHTARRFHAPIPVASAKIMPRFKKEYNTLLTLTMKPINFDYENMAISNNILQPKPGISINYLKT